MNITVHKNGQQLGPFTEAQVGNMLSSGQLGPADLGWAEGMPEWKPLSSFPGLLNTSQSIPASIQPAAASSKTEPLAIWSLVLGIISIVGFAIGGCLAGIPAVICGHLGRSKIRKNPSLRGAGMALAGLITGYFGVAVLLLGVIATLALPAITGSLEKEKAKQMLSNMKQLHLCVFQAQLDATTTGDTTIGFPASAKIKTKAELKKMLTGYVSASDLDHLGFDKISVANVSDEDPADTIFLKAASPDGRYTIIFRKGGDGAIYRRGENILARDPPRSPAFLE
jgi:type II secretory pathway pseudopilin PulG